MINIVKGEKPNGSGGCLHHNHTNGFTLGPPYGKQNGSVFQRCQLCCCSFRCWELSNWSMGRRIFSNWAAMFGSSTKQFHQLFMLANCKKEKMTSRTHSPEMSPPPPQILIIIKKSQTRQIKLTEIWNKKLLTKRQSSKFPPWNIWQHSDSVYAVFFTHLFRLRWISLLKINKYRSKQTQERQLLHFCPADLNLRHLFSYNPSHRKFIYTDRAFWNSAGLVNLQHSQCMSFSIKITLPGCSMPRVNIWADEG